MDIHGVAFCVATGLTLGLWRRDRRAMAVAAVAVIGAVVCTTLAAQALPIRLMLVLHEGQEDAVQQAIWTRDPWFGAMLHAGLPLRDTVALRVGASWAACVGLCWAAWRRAGAAGFAAVIAVAATPWAAHAALSAEPAMPLVLATLLGGAAVGAEGPRIARAAAVLSFGYAATAYRSEAAILAACAAVGVVVQVPMERAWWRRAGLGLAVVVASSASLYLADLVVPHLGLATSLRLNPGSPWGARHLVSLRLPVDVVAFGSPVLLGLVAAGAVRVTAAGGAWPFALLGGVITARMYALAAHNGAAPLETLRYGAILLGLLGLLAVEGAAALRSWAGRWSLGAALAFAASALAPWPLRPAPLAASWWTPIETTQVVGAQFIAAAAEENPDCELVTWLAEPERPEGEASPPTFQPARYGVALRPGGPRVDARAGALVRGEGEAGCALRVRGLDCNVAGAPCEGWFEQADQRLELDLPEHNTHHLRHVRPLQLSVGPAAR